MSCACGKTKVQKNPVKQVTKRVRTAVSSNVKRSVNRPIIRRPAR